MPAMVAHNRHSFSIRALAKSRTPKLSVSFGRTAVRPYTVYILRTMLQSLPARLCGYSVATAPVIFSSS